MDLSPYLWLTVLTIGVAVLGGAIAYGMMRNRKRTNSEKAATEAATRQEYREEDREAE